MLGILTSFRFTQSENVPLISVIPSGSLADTNPVQPSKLPLTPVTPNGTSTDLKPVHPLKASYPIFLNELGNVIDSISVCPLNTLLAIYTTPSGITGSVSFLSYFKRVPAAIMTSFPI